MAKQVDLKSQLELDADDEALNRWKQSLVGRGSVVADDPRKVIIVGMALVVEGRPDIELSLDTPEAVAALKKSPFILKEGSTYRMRIRFKVQHDVVLVFKYQQVVSKMGMKNKSTTMIGSFPPGPDVQEFVFEEETVPSGMIARGSYKAQARFFDDDNVTHLEFPYSFDIKKKWGDEK